MAVLNLNFDKDVLPLVRERAHAAFQYDSDRPMKVADSVSEAWCLLQTAGPNATRESIAGFAVLRVKSSRQFSQSERSLTGPNPRRRADKATPCEFHVGMTARDGDDPAELAAMRIDFPEWFSLLKHRQREICTALMMGETTKELAGRFGVTPGAISQLRRWLVENWLAFTA